jgi:hypothetical protein
MKYLKSFKKFDENAAASASSTAGMGAVSAAQPGSLAGTTGTTGSGDISFYMLDKKGRKIKKGNPSEVSDMRYLAPAKGVTKVKESKTESRNPKTNLEVKKIIDDCTIEIKDDDFELTMLEYDTDREFVDLSDDGSDGGFLDYEELRISFNKMMFGTWTGNYLVRCRFDKNGENNRRVSTLRASGSEMRPEEQELFDKLEDSAIKLINILDYEYGYFTMEWTSVGGIYFNSDRNISINVSFVLYNNVKN